MSRRYTMRAEYPLAGADDGLPVTITFTHHKGRPAVRYLRNGDPGYPADPELVELHEVAPADGCELPTIIRQALWCWACDYLESDEGASAALEVVADEYEQAREYAAELRAERRREP